MGLLDVTDIFLLLLLWFLIDSSVGDRSRGRDLDRTACCGASFFVDGCGRFFGDL